MSPASPEHRRARRTGAPAAVLIALAALFALLACPAASLAADRDTRRDELWNAAYATVQEAQALLWDAEDYEGAARKAEESAALWEKVRADYRTSPKLQPYLVHIDGYIAQSLVIIAHSFIERGDRARPEPLLRRAIALRENVAGGDTVILPAALYNLGRLVALRGDYAGAEPLLARAVASSDSLVSRVAIQSSTGLASLYTAMGKYARADEVLERVETPKPPYRLGILTARAELSIAQGDLARARRELDEALRQIGSTPWTQRPDHPAAALCLLSLARLHEESGEPERGRPFAVRALAIREKIFGAESPILAPTLERLASIEIAAGSSALAEPLLERALSLRDRAFGGDHPGRVATLALAGRARAGRGDAAGAEARLREALALGEKTLGAEHPEIAEIALALGDLRRAGFDRAAAEALYRRALAIREKALAADHPGTAAALDRIAALHVERGDTALALPLLVKSSALRDRRLLALLAVPGEEQKAADTAALLAQSDLLHNAALAAGKGAAPVRRDALSLALTSVLRRKGRALDSMADSRAALRDRLGPDDAILLDELVALESKIVSLIVRGPGVFAPERHRAAIAELQKQKLRLEEKMNRTAAPLLESDGLPTLAQVTKAIPREAALVEIVVYRSWAPASQTMPMRSAVPASHGVPRAGGHGGDGNGESGGHGGDGHGGESHYAAYVLRQGSLAAVDLGPAAAIDALASELRASLSDPARDPGPKARELDARVMQPVRALLGGARWILLCPDGELNLIPFGALVDEDGRYLVERSSFTYLTSGRDLLRYGFADEPREGGVAALIVGAPDFGPIERKPSRFRREEIESGALVKRSVDMDRIAFPPLSGTAEEARAIGAALPGAKVLLGGDATEEAIKAARHPRILHLATHGFFLPAERRGDAAGKAADPAAPEGRAADPGASRENPLLRSGVALASANRPERGKEDGVLTALEASGLDLYGTKLVVLSACETGVGEPRRGEGVYGMRRALVLAGAETQVMSLWKVSDRATRDLMIAYYEKLRAGGGRSEAMRQVQLGMLASRVTRHPYFWAGFLVSGNGASLDGRQIAPASAPPRVPPVPRGCGCFVGDEGRGRAGAGKLLGVALSGAIAAARRARRRRAATCCALSRASSASSSRLHREP